MAYFTPDNTSFNVDTVTQVIQTDRVEAGFVNSYYQKFLDNDAYLKWQMAKMNRVTTVTFPASGWSGATAPYTQTISIAGYDGTTVAGTERPEITIYTGGVAIADVEDYLEQCGYIYKIETGTGTLTASAFELPTMDLKFDVKGV